MNRHAINLAAAVELLLSLQRTGLGNTYVAELARRKMKREAEALFCRPMTFDTFGWLTGLSIVECDHIAAARDALRARREQQQREEAATDHARLVREIEAQRVTAGLVEA